MQRYGFYFESKNSFFLFYNYPFTLHLPNNICFVSRIFEAIKHTVKTMLNSMNSTDTKVFFLLLLLINCPSSFIYHSNSFFHTVTIRRHLTFLQHEQPPFCVVVMLRQSTIFKPYAFHMGYKITQFSLEKSGEHQLLSDKYQFSCRK